MAKRDLPGIGLKGNYGIGDDGWGEDQNLNLLKLSVLVQAGIKARVAAVPVDPAPVQGDSYILTAAPNAQTVAVFDGGAWAYFTPAEGWWFYDRGANKYVSFDGAAWAEFVGGGGDSGEGGDPAPTLISSKHWRVVTTAYSGQSYWGYAELRFVDADGAVLSVGGAASATGQFDSARGPDKAFDGNIAQDNQSGYLYANFTVGNWVGYTTPEPIAPTGLLVYPLANTGESNMTVQVQYKDGDAGPWTNIGEPVNLGTAGLVYQQPTGVLIQTASTGGGASSLPAGGTTGQVLTKLSDDDGDAGWTDSPAGGGGFASQKRVMLYRATNFDGPDSDVTILPWDQKSIDVGNWFVGGTDVVVPAGVTLVRFTAGVAVAGQNGELFVNVTKNGSNDYPGSPVSNRESAGTDDAVTVVSGLVSVVSGDIFRLEVYGAGGNIFRANKTWLLVENAL